MILDIPLFSIGILYLERGQISDEMSTYRRLVYYVIRELALGDGTSKTPEFSRKKVKKGVFWGTFPGQIQISTWRPPKIGILEISTLL